MSRPLSIHCPECSAKLKVPSASILGQRVNCPKCRHAFVAQASQASESSSAEIPVQLDPPAAAPAPPLSGTILRRGQFHDESSDEIPEPSVPWTERLGDNGFLYIGGAVAAVLVLVFAIVFVGGGSHDDGSSTTGTTNVQTTVRTPQTLGAGNGSAASTTGTKQPGPTNTQSTATTHVASAARPLDLTFVPPDAELLAVVRTAEIQKSDLFRPLLASSWISELAATWTDLTGSPTGDIDAVTLAIGGVSKLPAGQPPRAALARLLSAPESLAIVRLGKGVDASKLNLDRQGHVSVSHRGKMYFRGPALAGGNERLGCYVNGKSLVLLGSESAVKAAIERGEKPSRRPELAFVEAGSPVTFVWTTKDPAGAQWLTALLDPTNAQAGPGLTGAKLAPRCMCLSLDTAGTGALRWEIDCADAATAGQLRQWIQERLKALRESGIAGVNLPPTVRDLISALAGNLKSELQGSLVKWNGALPVSAPDALAPLPGLLLAMGGISPEGLLLFTDRAEGAPRKLVTTLGVPAGLNAQAFVRWNSAKPGSDLPPSLDVVVDLHGGPATTAIAYSLPPQIETLGDNEFPLERLDRVKGGPMSQPLLRLDRSPGAGHPDDGMRIVFSFERPDRIPSLITEFETTLKFRSARETKPLILKGARSLANKPLNQPELKATGLTCTLERNREKLVFRAKGRDPWLIGSVQAVDSQGDPLSDQTCERFDESGEVRFELPFNDETPRDLGLALAVHSGSKEISVPLHFQGLEVPPPPRRRRPPVNSAEPEGQPAPLAYAAPDFSLTSDQLMEAFSNDAGAAAHRFRLKSIEVTGVVVQVQETGATREVTLSAGQEKRIHCGGLRDITRVDRLARQGKTVTIRGTFLGVGNTDFVALAQCELLAK